jgi:hypothetical protein
VTGLRGSARLTLQAITLNTSLRGLNGPLSFFGTQGPRRVEGFQFKHQTRKTLTSLIMRSLLFGGPTAEDAVGERLQLLFTQVADFGGQFCTGVGCHH